MNSFIFIGNIILITSFPITTIYELIDPCPCSSYTTQANCPCIWSDNKCRDKTCVDMAEYECQLNSSYCKWDTTCKIIKCSELVTNIGCTFFSKSSCIWSNNTCHTFTQCSDYAPENGSCQSMKCQDNADHTQCEDIIITHCADFKTELTCYDSSYENCFFDDTSCKPITDCTQITDSERCLQFYQKCKFDTTCRAFTCSDFTNSDRCSYTFSTFSFSIVTKIICYWDIAISKCFEAPDSSVLTAETCTINTQAQYWWSNGQCRDTLYKPPLKQCSSVESDPQILPNSNQDSNSSQYTEENPNPQTLPIEKYQNPKNSEEDLNQSNTNQVLNIETPPQDSSNQLPLNETLNPKTYSTPFLATKVCACTEILSQTDCNATKFCVWKTSCQVNVCFIRTNQIECEIQGPCIWTGAECIFFSNCAYYKVTISTQCSLFGPCTIPTKANMDGTYNCIDALPVTCSAFTSSDTCLGKQSDHKECTWANKSCVAYDLTTCGGILDQTTCTAKNCKWDTACTVQTCADQTTSTTCTLIRRDPLPAVQICSWNATTKVCSDQIDANDLTSTNCASLTGYRLKWNLMSNKCEDCTGISSKYNIILVAILGIMMLGL